MKPFIRLNQLMLAGFEGLLLAVAVGALGSPFCGELRLAADGFDGFSSPAGKSNMTFFSLTWPAGHRVAPLMRNATGPMQSVDCLPLRGQCSRAAPSRASQSQLILIFYCGLIGSDALILILIFPDNVSNIRDPRSPLGLSWHHGHQGGQGEPRKARRLRRV